MDGWRRQCHLVVTWRTTVETSGKLLAHWHVWKHRKAAPAASGEALHAALAASEGPPHTQEMRCFSVVLALQPAYRPCSVNCFVAHVLLC